MHAVTHRLIVPDPAGERWLVTAAGALPRVATADVHTADTEQLNAAVLDRWRMRCTVLWSVHHYTAAGGSVERAHVLELEGAPPAELVWCADPDASRDRLDTAALVRWLSTRDRADGDGREWMRPGWRAEALAWIAAAVRHAGGGRVREVVQIRTWHSSTVLRVTADVFHCYFKAVPTSIAAEVQVTRYLAARFPDFLPRLLAVDLERRWQLTEAFAGRPLDAAEPERWPRAARRYGELQSAAAEHVDAFKALGCARRTPRQLAAELPGLIDDPAVVAELRRRCAALERSRLPFTLEHGDLWPGNVLTDRSTSVLIDWEDACVAPPLLGLAPLLAGLSSHPAATRGALEEVQRAYLDAFTGYAPVPRLEKLLRLVLPLAFCDMALRYRRQRPSVARQHPWMRDLVPEALARAKALL
ncbi:MAG TPA: aminoglycoside phosphotransferase family protein [Gammaproteobacteria bacterium]|nr:aminoglycoside phosphotransferase family protein [Gammaproteobacteria bacterium]